MKKQKRQSIHSHPQLEQFYRLSSYTVLVHPMWKYHFTAYSEYDENYIVVPKEEFEILKEWRIKEGLQKY